MITNDSIFNWEKPTGRTRSMTCDMTVNTKSGYTLINQDFLSRNAIQAKNLKVAFEFSRDTKFLVFNPGEPIDAFEFKTKRPNASPQCFELSISKRILDVFGVEGTKARFKLTKYQTFGSMVFYKIELLTPKKSAQ